MKRLDSGVMVLFLSLCAMGLARADGLEGVWKLASGRWVMGPEQGDLVYPGDPSLEGSQSWRIFTPTLHFFIADAPGLSMHKAVVANWSARDGRLTLEVTLAPPGIREQASTWDYSLEGDRLVVRMDGVHEEWVRVE